MAGGAGRGKMRRGLLAASAIVALAIGLALLADAGRPRVIRRPAAGGRPVLLVADFVNRTGRGGLTPLTDAFTAAVRARLSRAPDGIFEVSPRRLRPVLGERERALGLAGIAARLGADYVLVGSLEAGAGRPLGPGSSWAPLGPAPEAEATPEGEAIRLEVLLVRNVERPEVFAERFPLASAAPDEPERERIARVVADRIALSLRRP